MELPEETTEQMLYHTEIPVRVLDMYIIPDSLIWRLWGLRYEILRKQNNNRLEFRSSQRPLCKTMQQPDQPLKSTFNLPTYSRTEHFQTQAVLPPYRS